MYRVVAVALLLALLVGACMGSVPNDAASVDATSRQEAPAQQTEQIVKVYKPPT